MKDKILEQLDQLDIQFRVVGERDGENYIAYKDEVAEAIEKMYSGMSCGNCKNSYKCNGLALIGCKVIRTFIIEPEKQKCNNWEARNEG